MADVVILQYWLLGDCQEYVVYYNKKLKDSKEADIKNDRAINTADFCLVKEVILDINLA